MTITVAAPAVRPAAFRVRAATPADAPGVHAIYAPLVRDTTVSFELEVPSVDVLAGRIAATRRAYPYLVAVDDTDADTDTGGGAVRGYAYGSRLRERAAYDASAEVSVYVAADARRHGVARALYAALFDALAAQGVCHAFAAVTLPNDASLALHHRLGFAHVGTWPRVGFKHGRWCDVWWGHRALRPDAVPPGLTRPATAV